MPAPASHPPPIARDDMTGDQLADMHSERVVAETRYGPVTGGRVKNGCQVFLNVPYGRDVPRWEDPQPLPKEFRYSGEYTTDGLYAAQPGRSYTQHIPIRDRLGLGKPTENPFFADIYVPSDIELGQRSGSGSGRQSQHLRPVRVFIHGGFLQFGSTSGDIYNQQFFAAEHFGEVRVLLGHRVSVFGFLASEEPFVGGNYGFKDCWLGLQWVQENISAFGGDPNRVHLSGLSGGGHVVHQLLHYAARRAPLPAPFVTALLQSNAILAAPLTRADRAEQFAALCTELGVDPSSPSALEHLKDESRFSTQDIVGAVERMGSQSTFRGVAADDGWVSPDQLAYQRTTMGRDLRRAGVKCVITGDVRDEDNFYALCHDTPDTASLLPNVARYYPENVAAALLATYDALPEDAPAEACQARLGRVLADGQVHLPVRLLASDLVPSLPTVRYTVELVPSALGYNGKVSHGSDLAIQHLRTSVLTPAETEAALAWHAELNRAVGPALDGGEFVQRGEEEVLMLQSNGTTAWVKDWRWPLLRAAQRVVRPDV